MADDLCDARPVCWSRQAPAAFCDGHLPLGISWLALQNEVWAESGRARERARERERETGCRRAAPLRVRFRPVERKVDRQRRERERGVRSP